MLIRLLSLPPQPASTAPQSSRCSSPQVLCLHLDPSAGLAGQTCLLHGFSRRDHHTQKLHHLASSGALEDGGGDSVGRITAEHCRELLDRALGLGEVDKLRQLLPLQPAQLPRQHVRILEAAELIGEAEALGIAARPHPPPRQLVHLVGTQLAGVHDELGEVRVALAAHPLGHVGLLLGPRRVRAHRVRKVAMRDAVVGDPDLLQRSPDHELAKDHSDAASDRRGLAHDLVGGGGDVVPTGRCKVAHRHHDRQACFLGAFELSADGIGGYG
mmetsp:Transcript_587/g.1353  ORF Transcript_587/g.1353 Transcript_587/m.1353 type:complete len:271 (-) Transcript_587:1158-1970(-)